MLMIPTTTIPVDSEYMPYPPLVPIEEARERWRRFEQGEFPDDFVLLYVNTETGSMELLDGEWIVTLALYLGIQMVPVWLWNETQPFSEGVLPHVGAADYATA